MVQFFGTTLENVKSAESAETQLCASVAIIYSSHGLLRIELLPKSAILGINMLRLCPHQESKSCSEITLLHSLIPEEMR